MPMKNLETSDPIVGSARPDSVNPVDRFALLVAAGINAWKQAGVHLVEMIDKDPDFPKRIRVAHPEISEDIILVFERIGRNQLNPLLLADGSPGAKALAELPFSEQEKWAKELIPVSVQRNGKRRTEMLRISELTSAQTKQCFWENKLLTVKEQEIRANALIAERAEPPLAVSTTPTKKAVEKLGCYIAKVGRNGVVTLTPTKETFKAQQVRVDRPPSSAGDFSGEILFFRNL